MFGSVHDRPSLATCVSTNDVAKALAAEGADDGTVVVADEQTGGRGTKGRGWHSAPGLGLYASVILRPGRSDIALIPAMAGVAVAEAVRAAAGIEARLKWPNDIVWRGKKLGGILSESAFRGDEVGYVVVGIGLNLRHRRADFPADIRLTGDIAPAGLEKAHGRDKARSGALDVTREMAGGIRARQKAGDRSGFRIAARLSGRIEDHRREGRRGFCRHAQGAGLSGPARRREEGQI